MIWNIRCPRIMSQMCVHTTPCPRSPNAMSPNYKIGRYLCQTQPAHTSESHRSTSSEHLTKWLKRNQLFENVFLLRRNVIKQKMLLQVISALGFYKRR